MHVTRTNGRLVDVSPGVAADLVLAETGGVAGGEECVRFEPVEAGRLEVAVAVADDAAVDDVAGPSAIADDVSVAFAEFSTVDVTRRRPMYATVPCGGLLPAGTG